VAFQFLKFEFPAGCGAGRIQIRIRTLLKRKCCTTAIRAVVYPPAAGKPFVKLSGIAAFHKIDTRFYFNN
jgi:hypothetical protein